MCTSLTLVFFLLYETGITLFYSWVRKESAEMAVWVVLGSKAMKLLFAACWLLLARFAFRIPLVPYVWFLLGILTVGMVYETAYFIKQNHEKQKNG